MAVQQRTSILALVAFMVASLAACDDSTDVESPVTCVTAPCDAGALRDGGGAPVGDAAISTGGTSPAAIVWQADALGGQPDSSAAIPVDARGAAMFDNGHVGGARSLDAALVRAEIDGVPGQVAPPAELAQQLGRAGLTPADRVVVYGQASDLAAARLVWTLAYAGQVDVHFLDGGFDAWMTGAYPVERGPSSPSATTYPDDAVDERLRVETEWVVDHLDDPNVFLVDARSQLEYAAGHIPGAVGLDWQGNVDGGRLRPRAELEARHRDIPRDATVVAYCQTGSRAAMTWLTLMHLGYTDVRLYDGSMAAWTQDPARPLE